MTAIRIRVQAEDFDAAAETEAMIRGRPGIGGVTAFTGLVRGGEATAGAEPVLAMTLEHYPGMTERQIGAIAAEAAGRWPLDAITIIHRTGRLVPGDRIVFCAAASAHRDAAFEACRFLMDWLKTRAPFWKREETPSGERWVEAKPEDEVAAARWEG